MSVTAPLVRLTSLDGTPMVVRADRIDGTFCRHIQPPDSADWETVTCVMVTGYRDYAAVRESQDRVWELAECALAGLPAPQEDDQ